MREIKFRAWDPETKKMFLPEDVLSATGDDGYLHLEQEFLPIEFTNQFKRQDSVILMQFTGLKDKNGKEIYEGDICTLCDFNFRKSDGSLDRENSIDHNLKKGVVEWVAYNCSFMVMERHLQREIYNQWNNSTKLRPNENDVYEVEVIGNIYENPEPLK